MSIAHGWESEEYFVDFSGDHFSLGQSLIVNFDRSLLPDGVRMTNTYPHDTRDEDAKVLGQWLDPIGNSSHTGDITRLVFFGKIEQAQGSIILGQILDKINQLCSVKS